MKTNSKEFQEILKQYFIDCMQFDTEIEDNMSIKDKFNRIYDIYELEMKKNFPRWSKYYGGELGCFVNWLQGLPTCFNIDYENHVIDELLKKWEIVPANALLPTVFKYRKRWFVETY